MKNDRIKELEQAIHTHPKYNNIAGIVALKNGKIYYENYFNQCTSTSRIHVYSVSKSIMSILIGIALDKGYIKSVNQKILDFFPDYTIKKNENTIQNITLKNLLTMTAPYKHKLPPLTYLKYFMSPNKVQFSLDRLGGKKPIGEFYYTPLVGPDILSGILAKSTGQSVLDFATENLFNPLGISVQQNIILHSAKEQSAFNKATHISGWVADSTSTNTGGWGLTLSPSDMAKIGQLYLDNGFWNEQQIISANWIHQSTKEHSRWKKMNLPYGYLWWVIDANDHSYAAIGDGGNILYINPKKNTVISIASLYKRNIHNRLELIKNYIEPILEP